MSSPAAAASWGYKGNPRPPRRPAIPPARGFFDGIGYAYVTRQMGTSLTGDPRDLTLSAALYAALR